MGDISKAPKPSPCGSCPYRRDAPTGLWHHSHYAILPEFDRPMAEQPPNVFECHQQDEHLCGGWVATHDMEQTFALRIALAYGRITAETFRACIEYVTKIPVFASGREAADHGLQDYENPPERTRRVVRKLEKTKDVTFG